MRNTYLQFFWRLLLLAWVSLTACSQGDRPPLGYVTGAVTMDGKPLVGAIVTFQPEKGRAAQGLTDGQGKYQLTYLDGVKGAKIGPSRVAISWPIGFNGSHVIPARYLGKTELTHVVQAGRNTANFALDSDPDAKPVSVRDD